jgi:hypothetical protein
MSPFSFRLYNDSYSVLSREHILVFGTGPMSRSSVMRAPSCSSDREGSLHPVPEIMLKARWYDLSVDLEPTTSGGRVLAAS